MFEGDKRYLSIFIHETTIKVAQVKTSGAVEKVVRATAAGTSADDLAKSLKSALTGFNRKAPVVCVIPASAATSKSIEVPSTDPKEIRSIINLQASRHTPYSREEVLIGHINLGATSVGTKILLVIAHRHPVRDRLMVLEKCGLTCEKVLFAPEGIGRLYAKGLNLKNEQVGLVDFTVNAVSFLVVGRSSVVFSRSVPMGIKQLMEPSAAARGAVPAAGATAPAADSDGAVRMMEELGKSLAAYQSEDTEAVDSCVVTTDNGAIKKILGELQTVLKVQTRVSPYVALIKAGAVKGKLQNDYADDSFLEVIAPVATLAKAEVNLMPEEMIVKRSVEQQSVEATKTCIGALLIMLLVGGVIMSKIYFKDVYLNKNLRERYAAQKQEVQKLQDRMAKTKIIRDYLQERMVSLDLFQELYRVTPTEIYLTSITLEEDGAIAVAGVAQTMSQVFTYVKKLDDSPMFDNPKTKSTATKKDAGKDVAVFEVTLKLNDGSGEKPKEVQKQALTKE